MIATLRAAQAHLTTAADTINQQTVAHGILKPPEPEAAAMANGGGGAIAPRGPSGFCSGGIQAGSISESDSAASAGTLPSPISTTVVASASGASSGDNELIVTGGTGAAPDSKRSMLPGQQGTPQTALQASPTHLLAEIICIEKPVHMCIDSRCRVWVTWHMKVSATLALPA